MESSELIDFSARQYPIDGNIIHTFGQLVAVAGPFFLNLGQDFAAVNSATPTLATVVGAFISPFSVITTLGVISILTGVLLLGIVTTTFSQETTIDNNLSFGLFSGGVLDTISSQYEQSLNRNSLSNNNGASLSSRVTDTSCDANFYKESDGTTCTACNCDATGSSSLQCADSTGQCTCNAGYKGTNCDASCGCDGTGSSSTSCDASTGQCTCNSGYSGTTCNTLTCATNFYKESDGSTCTG